MRSITAVLVLAVLLLAACGSSSPPASREASKTGAQVLKDAETAVSRARSVHAVARSRTPGSTVDVETVRGQGGTASFTDGRVHFDLIATGDRTVYIRGNRAYLLPDVAAALHGRWLKCAVGSYVGNFAVDTSAGLQLEQIHGALSNKGETTYKGQKVVEIGDASAGAKLYVAATGTPYPLALVTHSEAVTFSGFNATASVTAPENAAGISKFCDGVIYQSGP